jgi:heterodisulfide reductase subunit C
MVPNLYRPIHLDKTAGALQVELKEVLGIDIEVCLECGKCSGGCSNGHIFDYTPRKIVQLVKLGFEDTLMKMDALWICLSCQLCLDRCPAGIDIPRILDYLREKARRKGITVTRPNVLLFQELMLDSIRKRGKVAEFPLMLKFNFKSGQYLKDAGLGMKMFAKGKLSLLSPGVQNKEDVRRLFTSEPAQDKGKT